MFNRSVDSSKGASSIEYALLLSFLGLTIIGSSVALREGTASAFTRVGQVASTSDFDLAAFRDGGSDGTTDSSNNPHNGYTPPDGSADAADELTARTN